MTNDLDMDIVGKDVVPMPVMLYGKPTDEGTTRLRDRLEEFRVSFVETDIGQEETAAAYLEEVTGGKSKIPVVVFGDEEIILVDPSLEELDRALRQAGYSLSGE